jgi:hypothetical protein
LTTALLKPILFADCKRFINAFIHFSLNSFYHPTTVTAIYCKLMKRQ